MEEKIKQKLSAAFMPSTLLIQDFSHLHGGHYQNAQGGVGGTHFKITIRSERFKGLSKVQQHKLVHRALEKELTQGIHALSLDTGPA